MGLLIRKALLIGIILINRIMNIIDSSFYCLYTFIYRVNKKSSKWLAAFSATILMTYMFFLNSMIIYNLVTHSMTYHLVYWFFFTLFIVNYFLFIHKKRYEKLELKYKDISLSGKLLSWFFIFLLHILALVLILVDR
jgi:hypothetical protein